MYTSKERILGNYLSTLHDVAVVISGKFFDLPTHWDRNMLCQVVTFC